MNAIIYVRVSSEDQVSNTSLDQQEAECRAWCDHEGCRVQAVFREEGESAKTRNRPRLVQALDACSPVLAGNTSEGAAE